MKTKTHRNIGIVARYPVTVFTADGFLDGVTQHINSRGAFIRCRRPPRQHETATIRIQFSKRESLLVEAEVMMLHFSEPNESQEVVPLGMVVRFKNLSSVSRKRLRTVIAMHYEKKVQRMRVRN
ncbi:MAG: PilZ domain-containing protein [Deltaproteobacteria bacterium]|nr:PilZ domain-containing protein [Deltaproteobacteria bacterium]